MARTFPKYAAVETEPEEKRENPVIDIPQMNAGSPKTLREARHAIRMSDLAETNRRDEAPKEEEESDPDMKMIMPMYWLMKGLRGMMQMAGRM